MPVTIAVANSATFEVESPDHSVTLVYDPTTFTILLCRQFQSKRLAGNAALDQLRRGMALFSPDSTTVYAPCNRTW